MSLHLNGSSSISLKIKKKIKNCSFFKKQSTNLKQNIFDLDPEPFSPGRIQDTDPHQNEMKVKLPNRELILDISELTLVANSISTNLLNIYSTSILYPPIFITNIYHVKLE